MIKVAMLSGALALWFTACTEKKAAAPAAGSDSDGENDDQGDDEADEDTGEAGDVCADGVEKADLPDAFSGLVDDFCSKYKDDIQKTSALYNQNDYDADSASADKKKILVKDVKYNETDDEQSYNLFASNELSAKARDYFELNKLRNNKPDVYKDAGFEVNPDTTVCNVEPGDSSTKYEVYNDAEKDVVHYEAVANYKKSAMASMSSTLSQARITANRYARSLRSP